MKHHPVHYLSLGLILAVALFLFAFFAYDRSLQIAIAVAVSFAYFAWGVIHHLIHKDLYIVVALEYLLVSVLGFVIMLSIIYRT